MTFRRLHGRASSGTSVPIIDLTHVRPHGIARVFLTEYAALLQLGDQQLDDVVEIFRRVIRGAQLKTVDAPSSINATIWSATREGVPVMCGIDMPVPCLIAASRKVNFCPGTALKAPMIPAMFGASSVSIGASMSYFKKSMPKCADISANDASIGIRSVTIRSFSAGSAERHSRHAIMQARVSTNAFTFPASIPQHFETSIPRRIIPAP